MDNDQQVTDIVRVRDRFLNQPISREDHDTEVYDLQVEFAKAAKNRSLLVPLVSAVFFVILALGAYVATLLADQVNRQDQVAIGQFEDLKLKDLFDTAKKSQRDMEALNQQIEALKAQSADRQAQIRQEAKNQLDIVALSNDSAGVKEKKRADINDGMDRSLRKEVAAFNAQAAPLKAKVTEIQKKLDTYDNRIGAINKQNQEVLDSQQRVYQIERKKLTDQYEGRISRMTTDYKASLKQLKDNQAAYLEALNAKHASEIKDLILKYNPVITDPETLVLFSRYADQKNTFAPAPLAVSLNTLIKPEVHKSLQEKVVLARSLMAKIQTVDYTNSVPPLLHTLDQLTSDILSGYDGYLTPLGERVQSDDADLKAARRLKDGLAAWLEPNMNNLKEDGLLVDARDPQDLVVVLKKNVTLKGDETILLRNYENNDEVATLSLTPNNFYFQGKMLNQKNIFRAPKNGDHIQIKPKEQIK